MSDLIQIENLSLSYDSDTIIVHELSLRIQQGTITALVGPNGCGKSTLLRGLSRLLKPVKGNVHLDGRDIHAMKAKDLAKQLGILPQSPTAPDEVYSKPGHRRFIYYTRPAGTFAEFDRHEYLMPEAEVGKLIWALQQEPETVAQFESYRVDNGDVRDIMVCTHGSRDVACAKFGYPLYRHLRDEMARDNLRVWRVNHFGGHVFAPTLMDMPRGDYWAFVDPEDGRRIIERDGDFTPLGRKYRGSAALSYGFAQAMERDILLREGWVWMTYQRQGIELAKDEGDPPGWAEVRITYQSGDGSVRGAYEGRVTIAAHVETIGSTGDEKTHAYPQYQVTQLEKVE